MNRVTQYALDVLEGREIAGKYVKLACQRHLDDLEKSKLAPFVYYFDEEKADRLLEYAETLMIGEGEEVEPLTLASFQAFIFGSLHGWVHKETGYRRFRSSYVQVGRQNGKSMMNGVLGTYYSNFDGYNYAQVYCTATKQDQANIVLKEMIKFIETDEDLSECFKVKEYKNTIEALVTNGVVRALGRDTESIDGFRAYLGIVDEYHKHPTNQMYKLLEGGTTKLKECLISVITTAGFDLNSPCYELYEDCCRLLEGVYEDDKQFVYIAQLDKDDDIWDSSNWIKANPLVARDQEGIETLLTMASAAKRRGGSELRNFLTKHLNIWVQFTDNQYMNMEHWKKCASDLDLEDFRGKECYLGLDLSSGGDLTSLGAVFPYLKEEVKNYFVHSHSFIPKNRVKEHIETDKAPYDIWIRDGLLTVTETLGGIKTDYKYIIAYIKRIVEEYELIVNIIAYDPHNADAFLNDLEELGYNSIMIVQSAKNLNDATVDFRLEVEAKNIQYNRKNKLLTWSIANAKTVSNSFGEIKIDKHLKEKRIDPIDAVIDAYKMAMKGEVGLKLSQYVTDENLDKLGW
ncbi:terminase large subunit [Bacillus cereus]|uniref:Phage terminase, large subunit n=4 Tax=Bacillus cereus group TaxID=86661 RepID=A0A9W5VHL6_BACCE|nr:MULTISPECIES: terminase TerL endonuclease subunit [Bacillus cereus group]AGE76000.1 putative phage terminase, large subunit [Bacillus thuringiensis serovar kurstaki str. HD73]AIE31575.1 prophage LambdaBa02, terminase, large subunit [Bacillus thuringiensis serovar kurstaki str. HD-1]AJK40034.1 phage Terminase family protein [Bacillus thuringiensis serovar kurstaki]AKJ59003.1 terminase [Bacillus thuringiensis]ALL61696.1 terminase [Bacillus thuringiensis]